MSHDIPSITVLYQNVNGLRTKIDNIIDSAPVCMYDIIVFTETNLSPAISSYELGLHNYTVYRKDRCVESSSKASGGGVLVAVLGCLPSSVVCNPYNNIEALFVKIGSGSRCTMICAAYIPPNQPSSCYSDFSDAVVYVTSACGEINSSIIVGDFNLPNCDWTREQTVGLSVSEWILRDLASLMGLRQISHVLNSRNVQLDLVFSSTPDDHVVAVAADPLLPFEDIHPAIVISMKSPPRYKHVVYPAVPNLKGCNLDGVRSELISGTLLIGLGDDLDSFERFMHGLGDAIRRHSPMKRMGPSRFPRWFNAHLKQLVILKKTLHKKYKESLSDSAYYRFARVRDECKRVSRACHRGYVRHLESTIPSNTRVFWSFVNDLKRPSDSTVHMEFEGQTATEPGKICDLFASYFKSVYTPPTDGAPAYDFQTHLSISRCMVYPHEVKRKLLSLDVLKGAGPDGITPAVLRHCCNELAPVLARMFNVSLRSGVFPSSLKHSYVVPIFKSGKSADVRNYRPIVIQSTVGKVFEGLVLDYVYPKFKQVIIEEQHGFVAGRSTVTNLLLFQRDILDAFSRNNQVEAIYIDFAKAFDKVSHGHLLAKLSGYGIVGELWSWFRSYLQNRTLAVRYASGVSDTFTATSGVPQGSRLGPFLFLIFINDIGRNIGVNYLLFADDIKLYHEIRSGDDLTLLQDALNQLLQWCEDNRMVINPDKSKHITFRRILTPLAAEFYLDGVPIVRCDLVGDLGVMFDSSLDFGRHIDGICSKASRMMGFVLRISRFGLNSRTMVMLYKAVVRPNLEYASPIWSPYKLGLSDRLQSIQRRFVRILGLRSGYAYMEVPVARIEGDHDLLPLTTRRTMADLVVLHKIINGTIICPPLLLLVNFRAPASATRSQHLFEIPHLGRNYLLHSPIPRMLRTGNKVSSYVDFFADSMATFRRSIKPVLRD